MIKKFQNYILENKPVFFQSKFIEMLLLGILFWIISFLFGLMSIDIVVLQSGNIHNYYFGSFAVVHSIAMVIVYIIWALSFFKNNAIQHFYPLPKLYHVKLFLQIVLPAMLMVSVYYPYTYGAMVRTKSILNKSELIQDAQIINNAFPFLVQEKDNYKLRNRVYPSPFPVNVIQKSESNEWISANVYLKPTYTNHVIDTISLVLLNPLKCQQRTKIDEDEFILYQSHTETVVFDSCHSQSYDILDSVLMPPLVKPNHYFDVLNFSALLIDLDLIPSDTIRLGVNEDYYAKVIAPETHQIIQSKNREAINNRLTNFIKVCDKYKIKHTLISATLTDYLLQNDFKIRYPLTTTSEYGVIYPDAVAAAVEEEVNSPLLKEAHEKNATEEKCLAFVDTNSLNSIYYNYREAVNLNFENGIFWVIICISLLVATFLILAHSVDGVSGLLSIPVTGVVMLLAGLLAIGIKHDSSLMFVYCLMSAGFIWLGYFVIKSSQLSRRITTILVLMGFYAIPFFTTLLFFVIHDFSKIRKTNICGDNLDYYGYEVHPIHVILLGVVILFVYLPLLKKLKAKADE